MENGNGDLLAAYEDVREALRRTEEKLQTQQAVLDRLADIVTEHRPTLEEIKRVVADFYGISQQELLGQSRHNARPRLVIYYLARRMTGLSFKNIAQRMGRSDHSTVMICSDRLQRKIIRDEAFIFEVESVKARVADVVTNRIKQHRIK